MGKNSHIERRKIEAEMINRIYKYMCKILNKSKALKIIIEVIEKAAIEEGQRFAKQARSNPNLQHFKTVLNQWRDSLDIKIIEEDKNKLRFNVTKCNYIKVYKEIGLPPELIRVLSCYRDKPFAKGYSRNLKFTRNGTIIEGSPFCDFCYQWIK